MTKIFQLCLGQAKTMLVLSCLLIGYLVFLSSPALAQDTELLFDFLDDPALAGDSSSSVIVPDELDLSAELGLDEPEVVASPVETRSDYSDYVEDSGVVTDRVVIPDNVQLLRGSGGPVESLHGVAPVGVVGAVAPAVANLPNVPPFANTTMAVTAAKQEQSIATFDFGAVAVGTLEAPEFSYTGYSGAGDQTDGLHAAAVALMPAEPALYSTGLPVTGVALSAFVIASLFLLRQRRKFFIYPKC